MDKLEEAFVLSGLLSKEEYDSIQLKVKSEAISPLLAMEYLGKIPENTLLSIFSKIYNLPIFTFEKFSFQSIFQDILPRDVAIKYGAFPVDYKPPQLTVAVSDKKNIHQLSEIIRFKENLQIIPVLASELKIKEYTHKFYGKMDLTGFHKTDPSVQKNHSSRISINSTHFSEKDEGPVIKLVNDAILQCISQSASDIHIEPYESYLRIRLRIDGSLVEIAKPPSHMKSSLISRIKIMAGLNIAETRLPQDGAINVTVHERAIDFRVSSLPTLHGEKIVMRILDKANLQVDMTQLGFEEDQLRMFKKSISLPQGLILVTGPTGSGKTTTLYSVLQELNRDDVNIITAEDPVEYHLGGINQVQMKPDIGFDFSAALRSFLRQDPDIIMVGEIRDLETAEISVKASLTGHLVLSTLHTNSASETISRLLNMGVAGFNLVSSISCITAQRLMKKLCHMCKMEHTSIEKDLLFQMGITKNFLNKVKVFQGRGCPSCSRTGYKGRVAVHEVLVMNEDIKRSILSGASSLDLKKVSMQSGMRTLRQSALIKMIQGIVSPEEVLKITASDLDGG